MATLKDAARTYTSGPLNIAELDKVPTDIEVEEETFEFTDEKGQQKEGKNNVVVVEGQKYRVPNSVLKQLKEHLEDNPEMKHFKVKKSGHGLNTDYVVIPLGD